MQPSDLLQGSFQPSASEIADVICDLVKAGLLVGKFGALGAVTDTDQLIASGKHLRALGCSKSFTDALVSICVREGSDFVTQNREPSMTKIERLIVEYL
ncbi:hypothetical protein [Falsihalocynthiibacter sp. CO-5D18]|uniref:hypothetical protein n=1 Tax=Falsihalocynthiibacter sp. CO-5D18 TaxID=3240872 RepID=UPI0035109A08